EPIGLFDASRGRYHSAHEQDVSTIVQDGAMRYQALARLREMGAKLDLDDTERKVDTYVTREAVRRLQRACGWTPTPARAAAPACASATAAGGFRSHERRHRGRGGRRRARRR